MQYRYLGSSGLKVSALCLGSMTFGRETSVVESYGILDAFVEEGGNFIDTANVYSAGSSEQIVGDWVKGRDRHSLVLATKVRFPMASGPNDVGLSRKSILWQVEESLRRLGTDYIDLYQVHCWDAGTELEETLETLDGLVRSGRVRYIGASNFAGWQLQRALLLQRHAGLAPFRCLQPQYNLLCRSTEWELLPLALREGLGVIPWSPLRGGWLSGKYRRDMDAPPPGTRVERAEKEGWGESWSEYANEHTWKVLDALVSVAAETESHPAQVALQWLLGKAGVTSPIVGVRTKDQLETAIGALDVEIDEDQRKRLEEASRIEVPYPWSFVERANVGRTRP